MAAAIKYYGTVKGEQEGTCVLNIWVDGFVGSSTEIKLANLEVTYEGDGEDMYSMVLQPSNCNFDIEVDRAEDTSLNTWLNGLTGNESDIFIEVVRNSSREWIGKMLVDTTIIDDAPFYVYSGNASCGLGQLKDYDFDYALDSETPSKLVLGNALMTALLPCYTDQFYTSSDKYIVSTLNTYEENQQSYYTVKCSLEVNRITTTALIKDVEKSEPLTCADVVEYLLKTFGCRIRMQNGCWHIIKPDMYSQATVYRYNYSNRDYTSGPISVQSSNPLLTVEDANKLYTLAGNNFAYKPSLIRVDVLYKPTSGHWLIKDFNSSPYYPNLEVANLSTNPIELAGKIKYEVPRLFNGTTNTINGNVRLHVKVKAKENTTEKYWLTYSAALGFYWTQTANASAFIDLPNPNTAANTAEYDVKIILPVLVDTSIDNLGFEIYCVNQTPSCGQAIDFSIAWQARQQFDNGNYEADISYTATNQVLINNSVYKEHEIYIADNSNMLVSSAIQSKNYTTSAWENSSSWNLSYAAGTYLTIGQLLAKTIMQMQRTSIVMYQGSFMFGNSLSAFNSIDLDGSLYLFFNSGTFNYNSNTLQGDFIGLQNLSSDIGLSNGIPYRGDIGRIFADIGGIRNNIRDLTDSIGSIGPNIRDIYNQINIIKYQLGRTQPLLGDMIVLPEGYAAGTPTPLNISIDSNGNQTITVG